MSNTLAPGLRPRPAKEKVSGGIRSLNAASSTWREITSLQIEPSGYFIRNDRESSAGYQIRVLGSCLQDHRLLSIPSPLMLAKAIILPAVGFTPSKSIDSRPS